MRGITRASGAVRGEGPRASVRARADAPMAQGQAARVPGEGAGVLQAVEGEPTTPQQIFTRFLLDGDSLTVHRDPHDGPLAADL
jgi:hypothetical protein